MSVGGILNDAWPRILCQAFTMDAWAAHSREPQRKEPGTTAVAMIHKNDLLELMNKSEAVYLATVEDSVPRIRALVNLRRSDLYPGPSRFCRTQGFTVYLSTSAATNKVGEVQARPLASVYYCIPGEFHGITLTGPAEILTDPNLRKTLWDEAWRVYFPMGDSDPNYVLLRIKPTEAQGWWGREKFRLTPEDL